MSTENAGTEQTTADTDAAAVAAAAATAAKPDTQSQEDGGKKAPDGSSAAPAADVFAELDADTREWLQKREVKDAAAAAKLAREQAKLLGNAVRIPGKNATEEEKAEFLNKLGRPETADKYEFVAPKDLPAELPYDGEKAAKFKAKAHEIGLTQAQAAVIHDWFIEDQKGEYLHVAEDRVEELKQTAKAETDKLVKLWGPLDAPTAQANLEFADRFIMTTVGEKGWDELERLGAVQRVGDTRVVTSAVMAELFANAGMSLLKEGELVKGSNAVMGNPFADGPNFNMTAQMQAVQADPQHARSLINAAGKKPSDFGLTD